ncbi:MAG: hypothetical protein ACKPFK_27560 [Dolichospermum sp.]
MSTLFTAVSVEQQAIVAGGTLDIDAAIFVSRFKGNRKQQYGGTYAGHNGANSFGFQAIEESDSSSLAALISGELDLNKSRIV